MLELKLQEPKLTNEQRDTLTRLTATDDQLQRQYDLSNGLGMYVPLAWTEDVKPNYT